MSNIKLRKCACCGFNTLPEYPYEICDVCSWQDDGVQNDNPDMAGGANPLSLNEYRAKWLKDHHREEIA